MLEPKYIITLDASPEFGEPDEGPWAADVQYVNDNEREPDVKERSARWLVATTYTEHTSLETHGGEPGYVFFAQPFRYFIPEYDVDEIREIEDLL